MEMFIGTSSRAVLGGGVKPSFSAEFAGSETLDPRITFTRNSIGTFFNSAGLLQTATANVARFDYNPTTLAPRGLLIEEQRTNLLLQSRDMTQAAWTKTDVTVARNQVGLDGVANTACLMTQGVAGPAVALQNGAAVTAGSTITASFVVKRGNNDWVNIAAANNTTTNGVDVWVNLSTGAIGNVTAFGAATAASGSVVNLGGGWYRVTATCIPDGTYTIPQAYVRAVTGNGVNTRAANATYTVDCAQLEVGAFATSIIPTTTATVTRLADSASMTGTNFSSWYNATEGTLFAEFSVSISTLQRVWSINDTTANNRISSQAAVGSTGASFFIWSGGVAQPTAAGGTTNISAGVPVKYVGTWSASGTANSTNGNIASSTTPVTLPTVTQFQFGTERNFIWLNGHIRSIRYYPTRLPNATLQALTA